MKQMTKQKRNRLKYRDKTDGYQRQRGLRMGGKDEEK